MPWSKSSRKPRAQIERQHESDMPEKQEELSTSDADTMQYPGLNVIVPTVAAICLSTFLSALVSLPSEFLSVMIQYLTHTQDRTIVGVAVPSISNQFKSFDDISWYESAFLLTFSALQLPMGKIFVCCLPYPNLRCQFVK